MPSYLHPRSRSTSTLFTTTLAVSFLVVALPHVLPCPVDQRRFADGPDPTRRKKKAVQSAEQSDVGAMINATEGATQAPATEKTTLPRECPVPKPGGILGNWLGFKQTEKKEPLEVVVLPRTQPPSLVKSSKNDAS